MSSPLLITFGDKEGITFGLKRMFEYELFKT